jgi:hypothetical protein
MGQMQRQKRIEKEFRGNARPKVIYLALRRLALSFNGITKAAQDVAFRLAALKRSLPTDIGDHPMIEVQP